MNTCPPEPCAGCGLSLAGVPFKWGRPLHGIGWIHYGGPYGRRCYDLTDPAYIKF